MRSVTRPLIGLLALLALAGCRRPRPAPSGAADACAPAAHVADLPALLRETSGLAASRRHPGILWTHNDSGDEARLYALDTHGRLLGTVRVTGARNLDWEDIALGPCAAGDCLYIGDIGDNDAGRPEVQVYRVPEPAPGDAATAPAERLTLVYPDGPRDAEALFVMPDTGLYIVSKGRKGPVGLYRAPGGATTSEPMRLARIEQMAPRADGVDEMVTGADASQDGSWVAIRTYAWLRLYHPGADGRLTPAFAGSGAPLEDAGESQGEAVAFGRGDTLWLSSEAGPAGGSASLGRIQCRTLEAAGSRAPASGAGVGSTSP